MSEITDELVYESQGLLVPMAEPSGKGQYSCFNTGGVETEVGEFLYGLVKMMKPDRILETGTHWGISSMYMARAMKDNRRGVLTTIEAAQENADKAQKLWQNTGVDGMIDSHVCWVDNFDPKDTQYDILFLDTEPQIRFLELVRFWPNLRPGGIVFIHDLHPHMGQVGIVAHDEMNWPWGMLPDRIKEMIKDHELQSFHFPTPRGLYIGQKAGADFYSTKILKGEA